MKRLAVLLSCVAVLGANAAQTSFDNSRRVIEGGVEVPVCNSTTKEVAMDAFVEQKSRNGKWIKDYNFNVVKSRVYLQPNDSMTVMVSPTQSVKSNSEYRLAVVFDNDVVNYQSLDLNQASSVE